MGGETGWNQTSGREEELETWRGSWFKKHRRKLQSEALGEGPGMGMWIQINERVMREVESISGLNIPPLRPGYNLK